MAETKNKVTLSQRWEGMKNELYKIVWPDGKTVAKQSTAVIIVSVIVALIIVFFDMLIQYGVDFLMNL